MRKPVVFLAVAVLAAAVASPARAQSKDIVDTAIGAGSFKVLVKLVQDAGLVGVLKSPGPFTVFAPTDEAFAKVPKETMDALAKDKKQLAAVLQYHVLTSAWTADDFKLVKSTGTASTAGLTPCIPSLKGTTLASWCVITLVAGTR